MVYSVTLRGDAESVYSQVKEKTWVSGIKAAQKDGQTVWDISVTDQEAAEDQLMSLLVSSGLKISDFGKKEQNLEDIFLSIVERSEK